MISVRLPTDIEQRLAELCRKTGRNKSFYIREAIAQSLDELEDFFLAVSRLELPGERYTQAEVEKAILGHELDSRMG